MLRIDINAQTAATIGPDLGEGSDKWKGFVLAEMLVALLVSATLLLGAFALLTNGTRLLSALEDRNSERFGLEAGLAAFRADLAQAVDVGTLEAGLDVNFTRSFG